MICTIDTEKILNKIQYPFTIETVKNLDIEGMQLQYKKGSI
jgi:hypothetical protein